MWSSTDPTVAEVSGTGVVTALANGSASIVVTGGAQADTAEVTVDQVSAVEDRQAGKIFKA